MNALPEKFSHYSDIPKLPWDLIIVGAGIVGVMCAYHAQMRNPTWRILIIDRGLAGRGATNYAGAIIGSFGKTEFKRFLGERGLSFYKQQIAEDQNLPIIQVPTCWLYADKNKDKCQQYIGNSPISDPMSEENLNRHYSMSYFNQNLYVADSYALLKFFLKRILNKQNTFLKENTQLRNLEKDKDTYVAFLQTGSAYISKRVIFSLGPWSPQPYLEKLLHFPKLKTKKVVALAINFPLEEEGFAFYERDIFFLPLKHRGYWLYSFTSQDWLDNWNTNSFNLSCQDIEIARTLIEDMLPNFLDYPYTTRIYADSYSSNGDPIIEINESGTLGVISGCSGSGFRLAPAMAECLLDKMNES